MNTIPDPEGQVQALLQSLGGNPIEARAAIRTIGPPEPTDDRLTAALVGLLSSPDLPLREDAARALVRIGRPAVAPLVAALTAADLDSRRGAVLTLGWIGPPAAEAVPALRELAADGELGPWAARALDRIGRRPRADRGWWHWWAAGCIGIVAAVAVIAVSAPAPEGVPSPAVTAGLALGFLGTGLGGLVGSRTGGVRRAFGMAAGYGAGAGAAGFLLGWIMGALVGPVVQALGH